MEDKKIGINELLEVFDGLEVLIELIISRLKDGYQFDDIPALFASIMSDNRLSKAVGNIGQVKNELKDLDMLEIKELMQRSLNLGFNIFYMLRK